MPLTLKTLPQGESALALIVPGVPKLDGLIGTDPETSRRFMRMRLGPMGGSEGRAQTERCLHSRCGAAGLRPVEGQDLVKRRLFATGGSLGRSIELVLAAIRRALDAGRGALDLRDLAVAFESQGALATSEPFTGPDWKAATPFRSSRRRAQGPRGLPPAADHGQPAPPRCAGRGREG